jgi:hypothetical protein
MSRRALKIVIPAKAGTEIYFSWAAAFAGVTKAG